MYKIAGSGPGSSGGVSGARGLEFMVSRKAVDSLGLIMSGGLNRDDQVIHCALQQSPYSSLSLLLRACIHLVSVLSQCSLSALSFKPISSLFSFILLYISNDRPSCCMFYSYPDRILPPFLKTITIRTSTHYLLLRNFLLHYVELCAN
jgi:hypothetical protein